MENLEHNEAKQESRKVEPKAENFDARIGDETKESNPMKAETSDPDRKEDFAEKTEKSIDAESFDPDQRVEAEDTPAGPETGDSEKKAENSVEQTENVPETPAAEVSQDSEKTEKEQTLYVTNEWKGYGKQNYYWNEYRLKGDTVTKYKCNRQKYFDGDENVWARTEKEVDSWKVGDPNMPEWLNKYIEK